MCDNVVVNSKQSIENFFSKSSSPLKPTLDPHSIIPISKIDLFTCDSVNDDELDCEIFAIDNEVVELCDSMSPGCEFSDMENTRLFPDSDCAISAPMLTIDTAASTHAISKSCHLHDGRQLAEVIDIDQIDDDNDLNMVYPVAISSHSLLKSSQCSSRSRGGSVKRNAVQTNPASGTKSETRHVSKREKLSASATATSSAGSIANFFTSNSLDRNKL